VVNKAKINVEQKMKMLWRAFMQILRAKLMPGEETELLPALKLLSEEVEVNLLNLS